MVKGSTRIRDGFEFLQDQESQTLGAYVFYTSLKFNSH